MRTPEHNAKIAAALKAYWNLNVPALRERLLAKVDQSAGPDACWPWLGHIDAKGYGVYKTGGRPQKAHRLVWKIVFGHALPDDKHLLHRCDNPPCVNPTHLYIGAWQENMQDAIERGQYRLGENRPNAKLTDAQVAEIRELYKLREWSQQKLADKFGVSQHHVSRLVRRVSRVR